MEPLKNKKVIIGVSSSISAFKVIELIKSLRSLGTNVYVIMTKHATRIFSPKEFEAASGNKVAIELFHMGWNFKDYLKNNQHINHISLADRADLFLIVPATANIIGKISNGIADDLLTTSVMATNAPVLICPAMNVKMWDNPIVQENVRKLRKNGYLFVGPEKGKLACGYDGVGRLANIDKICDEAKKVLFRQSDLKNKKILVTAGATMEEIDPVRVITNKSSGKMGIMIAEEAVKRGAEVTLIRGLTSIEPNGKLKDILVKSSRDMLETVRENMRNDIIIHAAAVSDFTTDRIDKKIRSTKDIHLELTPTTKILEKLKKLNKNIFLVGFKAEYNVTEKELINRAHNALKKSNADLIIANDVGKKGRGFDVDTNEVFIVDKDGIVKHIELDFKRVIANKILDEIKSRIA